MNTITIYKWIVQTIDSCNSSLQKQACINLINNFKKQFNNILFINKLNTFCYIKFKHIKLEEQDAYKYNPEAIKQIAIQDMYKSGISPNDIMSFQSYLKSTN